MNINFLLYKAYNNDLVSVNSFDMSADNSIIINTEASYNGDNFAPASIEIDTNQCQSFLTVSFDLYTFQVNPGTYMVRDITGVKIIKIVGAEIFTCNFYRGVKPEKIVSSPNAYANVNSINYKSAGLYETLKCNWNDTSKLWGWDATNVAPFNSGSLKDPKQLFNVDLRRIHLAMYSNLVFIHGGLNYQMNMYFGSDLGTYKGHGLGYTGKNFITMRGGALFLDAPVLRGAIFLAFDFAPALISTPAATTQNPGYLFGETFST